MGSLQRNRRIYGQWALTREPGLRNGARVVCSVSSVRTTGHPRAKEWSWTSLHIQELTQNGSMTFRRKHRQTSRPWIWQWILIYATRSVSKESKMDKWDFIRIQNFCAPVVVERMWLAFVLGSWEMDSKSLDSSKCLCYPWAPGTTSEFRLLDSFGMEAAHASKTSHLIGG